jgi:archaellum component FlaG (FlaF/FlaG flagellin family)
VIGGGGLGFATAAAFLIIFMAGITAAVELLSAGESYLTTLAENIKEQSKRDLEVLSTKIEIVNITESGGNTLIYVENTGSTTLDPDYVSLVIDGAWLESDVFTVSALGYFRVSYVNRTYLVKGAYHDSLADPPLILTTHDDTQVYNPSTPQPDQLYGIVGWFNITVAVSEFVPTNTSSSFYWKPGEVIEITAQRSVQSSVKVIVKNGVWDEYRVGEALPHAHVLPADNYNYGWD